MLENCRAIEQIHADNPEARIEPGAVILGYQKHGSKLSNVRISYGTILSFGDASTGFGNINIESGTWIGQYNNLRASEGAHISIGKNCLVSQFCTLIAANHQFQSGSSIMEQSLDTTKVGVQIGDDVWIGAGATILPGVTIGKGSIIGAGSVVTRSVPPMEIWFGIPSRKYGDRK